MKKIIALLLVLAMTLVLFCACGNNKTGNDDDSSVTDGTKAPTEIDKIAEKYGLGPADVALLKTLDAYSPSSKDVATLNKLITEGFEIKAGANVEGVKVDVTGVYNKDQKMTVDVVAEAMGQKLDASIAYDGKNVAAMSQFLTAGQWYGVSLENFADDFAKSVFMNPDSELSVKNVVPAEVLDMLNDVKNFDYAAKLEQLSKIAEDIIKKLGEKGILKAVESEGTVTVNGETLNAKIYTETFTKADFFTVIDVIVSEYKENKELSGLIDEILALFLKANVNDYDSKTGVGINATITPEMIDSAVAEFKDSMKDIEFSISAKSYVCGETVAKIDFSFSGGETDEIAAATASIEFGKTPSLENGIKLSLDATENGVAVGKIAGNINLTTAGTVKTLTYKIDITDVEKKETMSASCTISYDSADGKVKVVVVTVPDNTSIEINGIYKVSDTAINVKVESIIVNTTEVSYDPITYETTKTPKTQTITPAIYIDITFGNKEITMPQYSNLLKLNETKLKSLVTSIAAILGLGKEGVPDLGGQLDGAFVYVDTNGKTNVYQFMGDQFAYYVMNGENVETMVSGSFTYNGNKITMTSNEGVVVEAGLQIVPTGIIVDGVSFTAIDPMAGI